MRFVNYARAVGRAVRRIVDTAEGAVVLWGRKATSHVFELAGCAAIGYGAWLVDHPAGFMVGGVLAVGYAFLLDSGGRK